MFIDSHCHLDRYSNIKEILERAQQKNVCTFLSIGINRQNSIIVESLAREYPHVYASCGLHPSDVEKDFQESLCETLEDYENNICQWLEKSCQNKKIVALGETGLDFFKYHKSSIHSTAIPKFDIKELQKTAFKAHFHIARALDLPLIIHMRQSEEEFLFLMEEWQKYYGSVRGVIHCFTGSLSCGKKVLQWPGWYISLSGILTFPSSQDLRCCVKEFPLNRLLLETDAPWLAPQKHRGEINEPQFLIETAKKLAEITGFSLKDIEKQTSENFYHLFNKIII